MDNIGVVEKENDSTDNPLSDNENSSTSLDKEPQWGKKQKLQDSMEIEPDEVQAIAEIEPDEVQAIAEIESAEERTTNEKDKEPSQETEATNVAKEADDDDDNDVPVVRLRMDGIFEDDDDVVEIPNEDSQNDDPLDIQSMLQMSFREGDGQDASTTRNFEITGSNEITEIPSTRRDSRPRRAAAAAAANTIREIQSKEVDDDAAYKRRGGSRDETYEVQQEVQQSHICNYCKKRAICDVKVQQFGTEIYFCTNNCLNKHRSLVNENGRVPCANTNCHAPNAYSQRTYYWETMNFCTDRCVGAYQVEVGGRCATCSNAVPWLSLGKYCVRFGSDIRQFCCAQCLEAYKKNARVCFHCQLDIKRLGNVILANLPAKQSPKEFCSQDCVEMYVEQNINHNMTSKSTQSCICCICGEQKTSFKELTLSPPKSANLKACSEFCWKKLLETHQIMYPVKCETCSKYLNLDFSSESAAHYVSTNEKVHGFCSATCKNVFVLKHRQILACVTCKVKKYNYDLIQYFQGSTFSYATCSLNCLPCSESYVQTLKTAIIRSSGGSADTVQNVPSSEDFCSFPVINSVSSMSDQSGNANIYMNQPFVMDSYGNIVSAANSGRTVGVGSDSTFNLSQLFHMDSNAVKNFIANTTDAELEIIEQINLENWDGLITADAIEELLECWKIPPVMSTKYTMAKPKCSTASTQTDESAIKSMERVPLTTLTNTKYVPFPMPFPVFIPVPVYLMETPIPYPFPLPIPVPIPIPVVFNNLDSSPNLPVAVVVPEPEDVEMTDLEKDEGINQSSVVLEQTASDEIIVLSDSNDRDENFANCSIENEPSASNSVAASLIVKEPALPAKKKLTRVEYGIRAWKMSFGPQSDPVTFNTTELAEKLAEWVNKGTKPNVERYRADIILYLCLGVQQHLRDSGRSDNIFYDVAYNPFVDAITNYAETDCAQGINTRIEDSHFWESQQLGDASPGVLLFTLIYLLYKNFHFKTWEKHAALHFSQIKVERRMNPATGKDASFLRIADATDCDGLEVVERPDMPDKCPVRLLSLYISKCTHPDGQFYKAIAPDFDLSDSIWYSEEVLDQMQIYQMLVRAMMIKAESDR